MAKSSTPTPAAAPADETAPAPAETVDPFASLTVGDASDFMPALNVSPTITAMVDALANGPKSLPIGDLTADLVKVLLRDVRAYAKRKGVKVTIRQGVVGPNHVPGLKFSLPTPRAAAAGK